MPDFPLVLCTNTVAGATFDERVTAAAAGGYAGIGMRPSILNYALANGHTQRSLRTALDGAGVEVTEIETLWDWGLAPRDRDPAKPSLEDLPRVADTVGARTINVVPDTPGIGSGTDRAEADLERAARRLAAAADQAATAGVALTLEVHSRLGITDLAQACELAERTGRPNVGVLIDTWHFFRMNDGLDALDTVPASRLLAVQLVDGDAKIAVSLADDKQHRCRLPGEGAFDLAGFVRRLSARGIAVPIGVEIMSDELAALSPDEAARRTGDATRRLLAAATA